MTLRHIVNLGNSIIGVSLLAMPFCFKRCGIILSVVLILCSGVINRIGCHLLLKSAMHSKRRNFELLAYQTYGKFGKLMAEFGVLGFLLGSCVAFFVVIGDLGPSLVSELFSIPNGPHLRAFILTFLGMFVALPLGLLRRVDSLTSLSALSLGLYVFLVLKLFADASSHMSTSQNTFMENVNLWDTSSLFTTLPIFAMALSCQPQLFEIFDGSQIISEDYNSMKKLNSVIKDAVNLCSVVYVAVGIFGYVAFFDEPFRGNILVYLSPSFSSALTKIGFICTVIISLPLCLFPCRTSLHSMLFKKGTGSLLNDVSNTSVYMSDRHFTVLTIVLIVTTIGISVLLPHIEIILGIIGSTIGAIICFILPAAIFLNLKVNNAVERFMANCLFYFGIFIFIACSYSTLKDMKIVTDPSVVMESLKPNSILAEGRPPFHKVPNLDKASSVQTPVSKRPTVEPKAPVVNLEKERQQEEIIRRLEVQQKEHEKLIKEQKKILQEMKRHEETHHKSSEIVKTDINVLRPSDAINKRHESREDSAIKTVERPTQVNTTIQNKLQNNIQTQNNKLNNNRNIENERKSAVVQNKAQNKTKVRKTNSEPTINVKRILSRSDMNNSKKSQKSKDLTNEKQKEMLPKRDTLAIISNSTQTV
ncbi:putative sodium-coupled neutral amino acid transporter 10-like protein [Leptotrombidium deliense]|uniref:Putative sodium-coupled neutral amino acid transporter 10-like protein n=1 Tax=Leptotrombidium deliense TaxID=299467 RepID=A0A443SEP6_9ACAR|nr:putative sodium-coupled neutral amino acid transporter 10-like protein [Leptotrombidium deliense]